MTAGRNEIMQQVADLQREMKEEREKNERLTQKFTEATSNIESLEVDITNLKMKNRGQDDFNFVAMKNVLELKSINKQIARRFQAEDHPTTSGHVNSQPSSMQTSATSSGNFFSDFQTVAQYQAMQLQRMVADLRGTEGRDKVKEEKLTREFMEATESIKRLEGKLVNLQKVVAEQTDDHKKLQKDTNDNKSQITAVKLEIETVKQTAQSSSRQIEEIRRSGVGGASAPVAIPENLTQMFAEVERQLGLYDVKIAENDGKFQVLETTNYDGKLTWKIMDFSRRRDEARRQKTLSLYSQPFYTAKYGYKMCLRTYLNGNGMGENTHISLFFVLMKGEYDALLPFPFRQKVTLMLLDQGPDRRHLSDVFRPDPTSACFKKPTSDMNIASGCPMFAPHETINGSSYIKEDTIFIRVIVDTTDLANL